VIPTSAQVSVYPLGQDDLSPAVDHTLRILRQHGLDVTPGSMSTVVVGDAGVVFRALEEVYSHLARQGPVVLATTFSNACPGGF